MENKPYQESNLSFRSEPIDMSNPFLRSEPLHVSNPHECSEPDIRSNPLIKSEPSQMSNPRESSEPLHLSDPEPKSEPRDQSDPGLKSEPFPQRNPHGASDPLADSDRAKIRQLVEIYYDVQDVRIRSFNRLRTVGEVEGVHPDRLKELEQEIKKYIQGKIEDLPIYYRYLEGVKGLGPILCGGLISYFDPYKAEHASSFWRYAGLHAKDGKAIKRRKGEKTDFNPKLRTLCWKVGRSFLMSGNEEYRAIYEEARRKEREKLNHPEDDPKNCPHYKECLHSLLGRSLRTGRDVKTPPCKLHIHQRAMRKMIKRFLADFWSEWRKIEGLPVSEPYAISILKHQKR
ncbi:MAG: hypothetical protein QXS54_08515 [Candidatus Methanomethylicaceae archaeon]